MHFDSDYANHTHYDHDYAQQQHRKALGYPSLPKWLVLELVYYDVNVSIIILGILNAKLFRVLLDTSTGYECNCDCYMHDVRAHTNHFGSVMNELEDICER